MIVSAWKVEEYRFLTTEIERAADAGFRAWLKALRESMLSWDESR